jgi:hypothetical protein
MIKLGYKLMSEEHGNAKRVESSVEGYFARCPRARARGGWRGNERIVRKCPAYRQ